MLSLKKSHHFHLPRLQFISTPMQLSPVTSDDDELIEAIENSIIVHDDNWTLEAVPDTEQLERDWSRIQQDIEQDPEWFKFDNE